MLIFFPVITHELSRDPKPCIICPPIYIPPASGTLAETTSSAA